MRLPWLKIAQEIREASAPELATKLYPPCPPKLEAMLREHYKVESEHLERSLAGYGIIEVIGWSLGRCPEHEPPSAHAVVKGPTAAREIARVAGWRGDPDVYVKACASLTFPLLEIVAGGVRVRGLDRYDEAWGERHREAWAAWKAARPEKYPPTPPKHRRTFAEDSPKVQRPDPDPDADLQKPPLPPADAGGPKERSCTCTRRPCRHEKAAANAPPPPALPWSPDTPEGLAWKHRLDKLRAKGAAYAVCQLEKLEPARLVGAVLIVRSSDPYFAGWVSEHYQPLLADVGAMLELPEAEPAPPEHGGLRVLAGGAA